MKKNREHRFRTARAMWRDERLIVSTGLVERVWDWTGFGLLTLCVRHLASGREWADSSSTPAWKCDWTLPGLPRRPTAATLVDVRFRVHDDDGFTNEHLQMQVTMDYPEVGLRVRYLVRAWPEAPGVWTQLQVRRLTDVSPPGDPAPEPACVDRVPARAPLLRCIGYYNDTQHRNLPDTPILREEVRSIEPDESASCDWASVCCLEDGPHGLALVKESHKCVNQSGVDTGAFECSPDGFCSTGWGMLPADVPRRRFLPAWASWCVLWHGGSTERQFALKQFDRLRYPVDPERDIYIMANTWGSTDAGRDAKHAAREENVLLEIDSQADLGIDVQQIDDGWQGDRYDRWRPCPERYPEGWKNVVRHARRKAVTLGLWAAGEHISLADLEWNYRHGGFRYYKLDFLNLADRISLDRMMRKARAFILHSGHQVRVNWDVTENAPRVGYFFAREYGNIYLENRKPRVPPNAVYIPHLVLRDAWHLAHYLNLNKFQVPVQNIDRVAPELSDAHQYNHSYCVAITFMACPIFFQETHYYTSEARSEIRALLELYKKHRWELFQGWVFPLGAEPDNAQWTGFQNHDPLAGSGFLLLFRELRNTTSSQRLPLHFLAGKRVSLENLRDGRTRAVEVPEDGRVEFVIERPADFLFYRYRTG